MKEVILNSSKIVIVSHKSPDGDAIGSSLALKNYLFKIGKDATIVLPDSFPSFYDWMFESDRILIADKKKDLASNVIANADLIFCLDFNDLSRVGDLKDLIAQSKASKFMIDHHQNPSDFADYVISRTEACSTAQLIYEFIESMGDLELIDEKVAEGIYTGLITDSGSFKYSNVESKTHLIAAHLLSVGLNHTRIHDLIFDQNNLSRLKLLGYALSNIKLLDDFSVAYIALSRNELKQFNFSKGDTEGLVNYCLSIKGVEMAAFIKEDIDLVKMSFRSKGNIRVNDFASTFFHGGGHINAAGGRSELSFDETVVKFKYSLNVFLNE
jgi:phosphoesterase RecJ-like protein